MSLSEKEITGISPSSTPNWNESDPSRNNGNGTGQPYSVTDSSSTTQIATNGVSNVRPSRPGAVRAPSNAYAPMRRPAQYSNKPNPPRRGTMSLGWTRRTPNAEYRAQERAYVERLRQGVPEENEFFMDSRVPSLDYSTDSGTDDESSSNVDQMDNDNLDQDTLLYFGNDEMQPSVEELKIPENRERLEWHSMLASVLTGDVVEQEKRRLIGGVEQQGENSLKTELWLGLRAKVCGRSLAAQRRMIEDGRVGVKSMIEEIIAFEIQGEAEIGLTAEKQVESIVKKIEKCENMYPTKQAFEAANPRATSAAYRESCDAVISWHNTTALINTQLAILQSWVGNEELDFSKARQGSENDVQLSDDSSFIDRILKEDGLKSLKGEQSLLVGLDRVIKKAKATLIEQAEAFAIRHLPPYIEELLILINFPSRLIEDIIRMRLSYARNMKDPAQHAGIMVDQLISQFQILLKLAIRIKLVHMQISRSEPGWELPPCIDENFDGVLVDALRFYLKMLDKKLLSNKNTFKEAEILEQEWGFSNELGRNLQGGDVEVAEQFRYVVISRKMKPVANIDVHGSSLTSRSLKRLTDHFERELQRRPEEIATPDLEKRYKQILDSVRVRQRKLFRFSRILTQRFENCTEYNINIDQKLLQEVYDSLLMTGHVLIDMDGSENSNMSFIVSPSLENRATDIQSLLGTCYHAEENPEDSSNPYILIFNSSQPLSWTGRRMQLNIKQPQLEVKPRHLRLVADGSLQRLSTANVLFLQSIGVDLTVVIEQRANLPSVHRELQRIKQTTYKLSNTIMESVEIIRRQTAGLDCQELIQTCFAFATEFGKRSLMYMDHNRRALNNMKLTRLAIDWVSFICDDCEASDRRTFRWAVVALEFAMMMTRGQNILSIGEDEYAKLRAKVARCMSLLISHFDIIGARSTMAAQAEKQKSDAAYGRSRFDISRLKDDEESARLVREQWLEQLTEIDTFRTQKEAEQQALGRVLQDSNEADRALTCLSSSATNVTRRWQQGQFVGGGTFGSVYAAINLDTGQLMAVKEIRLQDPQLIPAVVSQVRDEMSVLQVLDHPNVVSYYGIEPHRDKVYIFMEYCSGGSLAGLLEHGRIADETVILVYTLQMLEGLAYLHQSGIVHRDVKPESKEALPADRISANCRYRYSSRPQRCHQVCGFRSSKSYR